MVAVPFMQGAAASMSEAAVTMPPAILDLATMKADTTVAARYTGGGASTFAVERFMAGEPLSQAAEALREGVTLDVLVA